VTCSEHISILSKFTTLKSLELCTKYYWFTNPPAVSAPMPGMHFPGMHMAAPFAPGIPPLPAGGGAMDDSGSEEEEDDGDDDREEREDEVEIPGRRSISVRRDGRRKMQVEDENLPQDEIASALSTLTNLTSLSIPDIYLTRWRCLTKFSNLTKLRIHKSPSLNDRVIHFLAQCTTLQTLDLSDCKYITTTGISHLTTLTSLTSLNLSRCYGITEWDILGSFPNLVILKLNRTELDDKAKTLYIPSLRALEVLSLDDTALTSNDITFLSTLPNLTHLQLRGCKSLDGHSLTPLTNLSYLNTLAIQTCDGVEHLNFVNFLTNLVNLDISHCRHLTDKAVLDLANMTTLQKLKMVGLIQVGQKTKKDIKEKLKYTVVEY